MTEPWGLCPLSITWYHSIGLRGGSTNLHSHEQSLRLPLPPQPDQQPGILRPEVWQVCCGSSGAFVSGCCQHFFLFFILFYFIYLFIYLFFLLSSEMCDFYLFFFNSGYSFYF